MKWWQREIIYQVYPKSFDSRGLKGFIERLDYLKSLGVGAIWLTPIFPSPMIDNGYDVSNYTDIDPRYGSLEDFDRFVAESKSRGIKIILDLVYNHTSDQHPWFLESKKNRTNSKSDFYIWRDQPTNWRGIFGGSAWEFCPERNQYYLHTFAKQQPDLNWENPEVRRELFNAANFWVDRGVSGFRIDAITYIKKPQDFRDEIPDGSDGLSSIHPLTANSPGILDFLFEFKKAVFDRGEIFTVAEANGVSPEDLKFWIGDSGAFDEVFEFSHLILSFESGREQWCHPRDWKLSELKRALNSTQAATRSNGFAPIFFENHDQPRAIDHFFPKIPKEFQNRAAKVLAVILITMRGTPFIFEGQELGLTNIDFKSIDEVDDISSKGQFEFALNEGFSESDALKFVKMFSRDNARVPMPWNLVDEESRDPDSVLNFYRKLSKLRHEIDGEYIPLLEDDERIFAFKRGSNFIIIANFSNDPIEIPSEILPSNFEIMLSTEKPIDSSYLQLEPIEARIYNLKL